MILKEFEQKLKTFLESCNTGKYKLRIVDKMEGQFQERFLKQN